MSLLKKGSFILLCSFFCFSASHAQHIDSSSNGMLNKPYRLNNYASPSVQQPFPFKSLIAPAFMIGYGFVTLKSDGLIDVNEKLHEEVWIENPHKKQHVDNYLQFAPAAAVYALNMAGIHGK